MIVRKIDGAWVEWRGVNETFAETVDTATLSYADGRQESVKVDPYTIEVRLSDRAIEGWPEERLRAFGLARPVPFTLPEGRRRIGTRWFEEIAGAVHEMFETEALPPPAPEPTRAEKIARMAGDYGLTVEDLKAEIAPATGGATEASR